MKKYISTILACLFVQLAWAQSGEGYDPQNPGDPQVYYRLTVEASPKKGGSVSPSSMQQLSAGATVYCYASANTGYKFKQWMVGDKVVSTESNFTYTMPEENVTLIAFFDWVGNDGYNPENPGDPFADGYQHKVTLYATPSAGGSFNISSFYLSEGKTANVYAYPSIGYRFVSWKQDGKIVSTSNPMEITMGTENLEYTAQFVYDPVSPENPGANRFNAATGELIIDDFQPGSLQNAIYNAIGGYEFYNSISSITISGKMEASDFGFSTRLLNCESIDLARTTGYTEIPMYSFEELSALSLLVLPECVKKIGKYAFRGCHNLTEIRCYSIVPPIVEENGFNSVSDNLIIKVPSYVLDLYYGTNPWSEYTILPLDDETCSIEVSLPENAADGRYKNMYIELVNVSSGRIIKYLITDRMTYNFAYLVRNTKYNIFIKNSLGLVFGSIFDIELESEDIKTSFDNLIEPQTVSLQILTPEGKEVTGDASITWYNSDQLYISHGTQINGLVPGSNVYYSIELPQNLGTRYSEQSQKEYIVKESDNVITEILCSFPQESLSGVVRDSLTETAMNGVLLSVSQTLNGKYYQSQITSTTNDGTYHLTVYDAPFTLTISANSYQSKTLHFDKVQDVGSQLDEIFLNYVTGLSVTTKISYQKSVSNGTSANLENIYPDITNVQYKIHNLTTDEDIKDIVVQYPILIIQSGCSDGDTLSITAYSKSNSFSDVTAECIISSEENTEVEIPIVQYGILMAKYARTENGNVIGMLYDKNGQLLYNRDYIGNSLTIEDIADGEYIFVSMGKSHMLGSVLNISDLSACNLNENVDYIRSEISVESGVISEVDIDIIPLLDDSRFYYTGNNTSFTVNKSSVAVGNYVTLKTNLEFKDEYKEKVSDVKLIYNLPQNCIFVDNSLISELGGINTLVEGKRITIELPLNHDVIRFCTIPTAGEECRPDAYVSFKIDGQIKYQPIGSVLVTAKNLDIEVPSTTSQKSISIYGNAPAKSVVEIYDDGAIVGKVNANAVGRWSCICSLNNTYNFSKHNIFAKVNTPSGLELFTDTKTLIYKTDHIYAKSVEMSFYNAFYNETKKVVFDLENNNTDNTSYSFYQATDITFAAILSDNDTTKIKDVTIKVLTDKGNTLLLPATYNMLKKCWIARRKFGSDELPTNVEVAILQTSNYLLDEKKLENIRTSYETFKTEQNAVSDYIKNLLTENENLITKQKSDSVFYSSQINSLENTQSGEERLNIVQQIFEHSTGEQIDLENLGDQISFNNINSLITLVDNMIAEGNNLLRTDSIDAIIDQLLAEKDDETFICNYDELINSIGDTLTFTDDGVTTVYMKMKLSDFDMSSVVDTTHIYTTTGRVIVQGYCDGGIVFVDSLHNEVVVMQSSSDTNNIPRRVFGERDFLSVFSENVNKLNGLATKVLTIFNPLLDNYRRERSLLEARRSVYEDSYKWKRNKYLETCRRIRENEKTLQDLIKNTPPDLPWDDAIKVERKIIELKGVQSRLLSGMTELDSKINDINRKLNSCKFKIKGLASMIGNVTNAISIVTDIINFVKYTNDAIDDFHRWNGLMDQLNYRCYSDKDKSVIIADRCKDDWNRTAWREGYVEAVGFSLLTNALNFCKSPNLVLNIALNMLSQGFSWGAQVFYDRAVSYSKSHYVQRYKEYSQLKCYDSNCKLVVSPSLAPNKTSSMEYRRTGTPLRISSSCTAGGNVCICPPDYCLCEKCKDKEPKSTPVRDPSGYVYEGVPSNRVEGVTATCYYKEQVEDMYGDLHDNIVKWNAEEFEQKNPLYTDKDGRYAWDVPQGLWQVKYEKEGYETAYSEWLPVPPPQLDVNIGIVQNRQPEVKEAHAYEDGVELTFDKYMMPAYLTADNIKVSQNGKYVEGKVVLVDEEVAYRDENVKYASTVRFVPNNAFSAGKEVTLVVTNRVKSYAGIQMADNFTQSFDIEKEVKSIVADSLVKVPYQGSKVITLYVQPADAAVGKTMHAESSSEMLASLVQKDIVIDENGMTQFEIRGELPGTTGITFSIDGVKATATVMANVDDFETSLINEPKASLVSGSSVYRGTAVKLTADSNDLKIWYTIDGTCPCDENGSRKQYTEPIVINGNVTIKAIAENADGDASDVATFIYSILQSKTGVELNNGWNWVSFNMKNEALNSVNTALVSGSWTSDDVVKDNKYVDMYSANQKQWIGTLSKHGALNNAQMYKVRSSKAQTLGLTGEAVHPTETTITLGAGWNYISYLPLVNMNVSDALKSYKAENGDVIKSQDAFATYSTTNGWEGDLTTLTVGRGYMLKRGANASQVSFTYPVESSGSSAKAAAPVKSYRYADNMNIIGEVEGISVEDGDSLVAYVNGEMRGASRLQRNHKVFLTVQGDEDVKMAIVLVRGGQIVATAANMIDYHSNNVLGTSDAPTSITFVPDDRSLDGTVGNVKAIYGINGIKMNTKRLNNIPSGTYIIYSEKNGNTCVTKLIK